MRAYIYFMQNLEAHDLQFKIYALLQMRYLDPRLNFRNVSPKRRQPILGEQQLRDSLWMPHIFLANERDSSILGEYWRTKTQTVEIPSFIAFCYQENLVGFYFVFYYKQ